MKRKKKGRKIIKIKKEGVSIMGLVQWMGYGHRAEKA